MQKITIYTDGAARGNPGPCGWGVIIFFENNNDKSKVESQKLKVVELGGYGGERGTNNQMELTAPIEALKYLKSLSVRQGLAIGEVKIYSDSKYVINGITDWVFNWIKNNWKNAAKKPVLNKELWVELYELNQEFKPKWEYVAGHSGHKENDRVDEIATSFADQIHIDLKK